MYKIDFTKRALKNLENITPKYQKLIIQKLENLAENPYSSANIKALKGEEGFFRLRIADYRVIFEIVNKELLILVIDINHRKDIY